MVGIPRTVLSSSFCRFLGRFGGLFERLGRRRALGARLAHLFAAAGLDALLFGMDVSV